VESDRISKWLSIGANLAVLASIVFLALEIRQNTEMTRAQITLGRSQNNIALADMQANSDYLPGIIAKAASGDELAPSERYRFNAHLRALLRMYDNDLQQYNQGLLGENIPRTIPRLINNWIVGNPYGRRYWERNKTSFSDEFVTLADSVIAENADAEAD
jgi:hypothetical protein